MSITDKLVFPVSRTVIKRLRPENVSLVVETLQKTARKGTTVYVGKERVQVAYQCAPLNLFKTAELHICAICDQRVRLPARTWSRAGMSLVRINKHCCVALLYCDNDLCHAAALAMTSAAFERLRRKPTAAP